MAHDEALRRLDEEVKRGNQRLREVLSEVRATEGRVNSARTSRFDRPYSAHKIYSERITADKIYAERTTGPPPGEFLDYFAQALDRIGETTPLLSPPAPRLPPLNELGMRIIGERVPHEDDLPVPSLEPGYILLPWDVGVPDGPSPWRRLLGPLGAFLSRWFGTPVR